MRKVRMSSALTTIYSLPETVVEDRLSELLTSCVNALNDWEVCGKLITETLELHCFTLTADSSEILMFENEKMKLFYCLSSKKTKLEISIREQSAVKMFINISKIKRLSDLSGNLKGKEYPFEIYKYGDKKRMIVNTKLVVDSATVDNEKTVVLRLSEI